jgi:gas vesicle protein
MNSGKVIIGTLAGVTAGTILGMLFAPEKGAVTRKNISEKGSEFKDNVKEKVNQYTDTMNQKIDDLREKAVEWLEHDKHMMEPEANKGNNI